MADQVTPLKLRTRAQLEKAIREGSQMGASLMAGRTFGSKAEREHVGRVLYGLSDVLGRAIAAGFLDPIGMETDT